MDIIEKCKFQVDLGKHFLEFRMSGFWSDEEAETVGVVFRKHVDELSGGGKKGFKVLIDAVDFPAQSESARTIILKSMSHSVNNGLEKSARIVSRAITQLQFKSMAKEVAPKEKAPAAQFGEFYTRAEALKWLDLSQNRGSTNP
jgi:hypothetical protein